jgi:hypothetical protein
MTIYFKDQGQHIGEPRGKPGGEGARLPDVQAVGRVHN